VKKIISILIIFLSLISYSQVKVIKKYDEFDKTSEIEIKNINIYDVKNDFLLIDLSKFCIYNELNNNVTCSNYTLIIKNKKKEISFIEPEISYIHFLFEDTTTLKVFYNGPFLLEAFDLSFTLTEEKFKEILIKKITKIRIYTDKENDYEIKSENALKLKEAIQEFLNAK
jgi:hypothetical protein